MAETPLDETRVSDAARAMRKRRFERTGAGKAFDASLPLTENELDDARATITAYLNSGPERAAGEMREALKACEPFLPMAFASTGRLGRADARNAGLAKAKEKLNAALALAEPQP